MSPALRPVRVVSARRRWPPLVMAVMMAIALVSPLAGVGLNTSPSVPRGLYRTVPEAPERGALVLVCLPAAIAAFGRGRGYLGPGPCPGGAQPVLKRVGAVAGDVVDLADSAVTVNGVAILARSIAPQDSSARPLPRIARGTYRVVGDALWLFGPSHRNSWDSRYFGPVPLSAVRAVVQPVLTLEDTRR